VAASAVMPSRTYPLSRHLDLAGTLRPLSRGPGDPTIRIAHDQAWWATRTVDGPATLALLVRDGEVRAEAFGPGAERVIEGVPALLALDRDDSPIPAGHPLVAQLDRRHAGIRIPRTGAVLESLVPAILEQKVTGLEARRAWIGLVRVHGESAPGPAAFGLRLPPSAATLAALPYYGYHPFGIEQRRADLIRAIAARARWFEAIADMPLGDGYERLLAVPGIGPWTAAEVGTRALGDEDAVSVGDFHLPNLVAFALAGEPRGTDDRMLELLEPYRGQRARVVRLLETSGIRAPRYGPRLSVRGIEDF
jgi:3-methyladenine DNA glycosylase/8-oxoguanine DNA glycosylase